MTPRSTVLKRRRNERGRGNLEFLNLADVPNAIPKIARWFYEQWGYLSIDNSVEKTCERLKGKLNHDQLPCLEVAVENNEVIAVGSLAWDSIRQSSYSLLQGAMRCSVTLNHVAENMSYRVDLGC